MIDYKGPDKSMPPVSIVFTDENDTIIRAVDSALHDFGYHFRLTSGNEGVHRKRSKHYVNAAVDCALVWRPDQEADVLRAIKTKLPPGYRFVRESSHLHIERATVPDNITGSVHA